MATHFQAETSSGSRCGEICSHSSSWRCWTACSRGSTIQTSSPPRSPSSRSRYAVTPAHNTCCHRAGLGHSWMQGHLYSEAESLRKVGFLLVSAKLGWSQHPTRPGGFAQGASEAPWPASSVCSQPQRHVIPMVALPLTNVCFPGALWIGVYVMNFWATPGGFAILSGT